jgi:hypothetical protein
MVFLLKFLQPAGTVCFQVTVRVAHSLREEPGFVADDRVSELIALPLVVPCPIRECSFDVRELSLRFSDG